MKNRYLLVACFLWAFSGLSAQRDSLWQWLKPADDFAPRRFWPVAGLGAATYGAVSYGLYQTWYKDYDLIGFRPFDDSREWLQMDKMGHFLTTYSEARLLWGGARWTGLSARQSRWTAGLTSMLLQTTVEVMDGFSAKWGFSWSDMAANTLGMGLMVGQDALWHEQRILLKLSVNLAPYATDPILSTDGMATTDLAARGRQLFGVSAAERALKDYNTMTIWASVNLKSFWPQKDWPSWLNASVGYGAANLYGGFTNEWTDEAGHTFVLPDDQVPRYRQYYLAPDIDLSRIPTRKPWLRVALNVLNFIKVPSPALELNGQGRLKFHWLYF